MKNQIPLLITFIAGFVMVLQYFIPHWPFSSLQGLFNNWFLIITVFAMILGVGNLLRLHLGKLHKRPSGWWYSIVLIIGFIVVFTAGMIWGIESGSPFDWLYFNINLPMSSTMFALLAFFVASASYRAFRARTPEATLLLVAAFFVMLGRVPLGDQMTNWVPNVLPSWLHFLQLPLIANWIMDFPHTAGRRAIMIGASLGI